MLNTKLKMKISTKVISMLIMTLGFWAYSIATAMQRVRNIILEREHSATLK